MELAAAGDGQPSGKHGAPVAVPAAHRRWLLTAVVAAAGTIAIYDNVTSASAPFAPVTIAALSILHGMALAATPSPSVRDRVAGAGALLCLFVASFLPAFFGDPGIGSLPTALTLAAVGSAPMWAYAVLLAARSRRTT